MTPPPDDDARRWLAALEARVEDDPDLLDALSDAEAERLLAQEDMRASGVAAAIRRRVREATPEAATREGAGVARSWLGSAGALGSAWSWWRHTPPEARGGIRAGLAILVVAAVAGTLWAVWETPGTAVGEVLEHRAELAALVGPPVKGDPGALPPLARGARDLLAAAETDPPDRPLAREAAETLARSARAETDPEAVGVRAYFAGLAYRLAGDDAAAEQWLRRVPEGTAYAARAAERL
ncbi:MAG: hypothetical protein AAFQ43_06745 [Bacteroidota bacterium]